MEKSYTFFSFFIVLFSDSLSKADERNHLHFSLRNLLAHGVCVRLFIKTFHHKDIISSSVTIPNFYQIALGVYCTDLNSFAKYRDISLKSLKGA